MFVNKKKWMYILIVSVIFLTVLLVGSIINRKTTYYEDGITDNSVQKIETNINSIRDGLPYAIKRVNEWRSDLYLDYISVAFNDEKQISDKKGIVSYNFYGKNVKDGLDASVEVKIDMNSNSIIQFMSSYGTSKVLLGGGQEIKISDWRIDINDAIETATKAIGKEKILKHDKPNVIIRCWANEWEVAVLSSGEHKKDDYRIELNPKMGEVIGDINKK